MKNTQNPPQFSWKINGSRAIDLKFRQWRTIPESDHNISPTKGEGYWKKRWINDQLWVILLFKKVGFFLEKNKLRMVRVKSVEEEQEVAGNFQKNSHICRHLFTERERGKKEGWMRQRGARGCGGGFWLYSKF